MFLLLLLKKDSKNVWIKSKANGVYIRLNNNSYLIASENAGDGTPEIFELNENDRKLISLSLSSNDNFISVDPVTNQLVANKKLPEKFRKFEKLSNADGSFSLKFALNSKFVSIDSLGGFELLANGLKNELWESFFIEEINEASTTATEINTTKAVNDAHEGFLPSFNEFSNAFTLNQYSKPTKKQFDFFKSGATYQGGITSKIEVAMFLTHVLIESNGLTTKVENKCGRGCLNCPTTYSFPSDWPGKLYCGRGYFQLVSLNPLF